MNPLIETTLDKLLADIEGGKLDWKKTWAGGGLPTNATTKRHYNGVNILLLWIAAQAAGYPTQDWATYKQWQAAGKQVAKGQKSSVIFIAKDAVKKAKEPGGEDEHYKFFRCAFVFNAAQLTEPPALAERQPITLEEKHARCKATVDGSSAIILTEGDQPAYSPTRDSIRMPAIDSFISADAYYATLFHELVHWTGHKTRLDRTLSQKRHEYAFEELVAEIGAAFLCAEHQVDELPGHDNHAAYLQTWLSHFKEDRASWLMKAASAASKAFAFIVDDDQSVQLEEAA